MGLVFQEVICFIQLVLVVVNVHVHLASAEIGVVYGMNGDNLPTHQEFVRICKKENIKLVRVRNPHPAVFEILRRSGLRVGVTMNNADLEKIAADANVASEWMTKNILSFVKDVDFSWIAVGNDIVPGPGSEILLKVMQVIRKELEARKLLKIAVSTILTVRNLVIYGPPSFPSRSQFSDGSALLLRPIIELLKEHNYPLLINVYPYKEIVADKHLAISLNYVLFDTKTEDDEVKDGPHRYTSAFEAMVDSFYVALEKLDWHNATVVVAETGWPWLGEKFDDKYANKENAEAYNSRLVNKMKNIGTPRRPSDELEIYINEMFNEDLEAIGIDRNWGIHYSDGTPIYPLNF